RQAPFDSRELRQALMHAVDYQLLIDVLIQGRGVPGGPGKVFTPVNTAFNNPDGEVPEYDPERARELIEQAGFRYDSQGRLRARQAPFDSRELRQALMHAVDYQLLIDVLIQGRGVPGGPGKVFTPVNTAFNNPDVEVPEYDPERARELIEQAGFRYDSQGRL